MKVFVTFILYYSYFAPDKSVGCMNGADGYRSAPGAGQYRDI